MRKIPDQWYTDWRWTCHAPLMLRDGPPRPTEHLLQLIWRHQRLQRDRLQLVDDRAVQILHPGFLNHEPGPDFREAIVRIDGESPRRGDIEIDLDTRGWHGHGHDHNPAFREVILHVVWESVKPTFLPTLELRHRLDSPLATLARWIENEPGDRLPLEYRGQCEGPLRELSEESLADLLRQAAMTRLRTKGLRFRARAQEAGWEQALWEGLFRGLGYKQNVWPMHLLAELRPRLPAARHDPMLLQALLLGLAGFLPTEGSGRSQASQSYTRQLWDHWWRQRDAWEDAMLPPLAWRRVGMRPANQPERRLALAAHWLSRQDLLPNLDRWAALDTTAPRLHAALLHILTTERDDYWSWHWTLRSPRLRQPSPLLGPMRLTDLAMNTVIPWLWMRSQEGGRHSLTERLVTRYQEWPSSEDNALLRLARERLFGSRKHHLPRGAAYQQGLLQILRDFCGKSNALCERCPFPDLTERWKRQKRRTDTKAGVSSSGRATRLPRQGAR